MLRAGARVCMLAQLTPLTVTHECALLLSPFFCFVFFGESFVLFCLFNLFPFFVFV